MGLDNTRMKQRCFPLLLAIWRWPEFEDLSSIYPGPLQKKSGT